MISKTVRLTQAQKGRVFQIYASGSFEMTPEEKRALAEASPFPAGSDEHRKELRSAQTEKELQQLGTVLTGSQLEAYRLLSK